MTGMHPCKGAFPNVPKSSAVNLTRERYQLKSSQFAQGLKGLLAPELGGGVSGAATVGGGGTAAIVG